MAGKVKVIGKGFVNDNKGILTENGMWKVNVIMTETFYYEDGTQESEVIEAECVDSSFTTAHREAVMSAMYALKDEVYDKGFTSLIQARKEARKLNDNSEDNANTPTE